MRRFLPSLFLKLIAILFSFSIACNESFARSEQDVKAAYLYNFIKFIDWPEHSSSHQQLCVLGKDSINDKLKKLDKKQVKGKTLNVLYLNTQEELTELDCSILFVGQSEEKFLSEIFSQRPNLATLTISSISDFTDAGGIIGFVKLGNVIRFDINLKQANLRELSISAKLLELANKVVK